MANSIEKNIEKGGITTVIVAGASIVTCSLAEVLNAVGVVIPGEIKATIVSFIAGLTIALMNANKHKRK
jgi:hypothetical protein